MTETTTGQDLRERMAQALYEDTGCSVPWLNITTDPDFAERALTWRGHADAVLEGVVQSELDRRDSEIADLKAQQLTEATAARKNIGRWTGQVKAAEAERDQFRRALELIGTRCESFTGPSTCVDDPGRSPQGKYLADRWCDGCISRTALNQPADSKET